MPRTLSSREEVRPRTAPRIRLLPIDTDEAPAWYEPADFRRIVDWAEKLDRRIRILALLAGSAGLRRGEIMALKWSDVDLRTGVIYVARAIWWARDAVMHETTPKGRKARPVKMTHALLDALQAHRRASKGERVLVTDEGCVLTNKVVRRWQEKARALAGVDPAGSSHRLRHSFCSHLMASGAPAIAVKELAGHASLSTTMRYAHVAPSTLDAAIGLLDAAWKRPEVGETVEKGAAAGA